MRHKNLLFERRDHVATITLDRPAVANSLDTLTARELMDVAIQCDEDASLRAVILTGSGAMFCAGGDVKAFASAGDRLPALLKELTTYLHAAVSRFARMRAPLIAAVNGTAAGAGMSLACASDFVIAAASAKFTMAYTRIGLVPDGSSTYFLPRIIGMRRTAELMMRNRVLTADDALAWGLASEVVPDGQALERAGVLAAELARGATGAFGRVKRLLQTSFSESLETQMELETREIAEAAASPEGREGIAAFSEKRPPRFTDIA